MCQPVATVVPQGAVYSTFLILPQLWMFTQVAKWNDNGLRTTLPHEVPHSGCLLFTQETKWNGNGLRATLPHEVPQGEANTFPYPFYPTVLPFLSKSFLISTIFPTLLFPLPYHPFHTLLCSQ